MKAPATPEYELPDGTNTALALETSRLRKLAHATVELVLAHLSDVAAGPVFQPMEPDERRRLLDQVLPKQGLAPETILTMVSEQVARHPMGNGHPRFFGWVNSAPAPLGVLGDFIAAAINPSCAGGDHAAIYLERCCIRWLEELVGFPTDGSMGILVSGASAASLTCLAAARQWSAAKAGWDVREEGLSSARPPSTLYVSEEGHSCIRKAAELLGLGARQMRTIPVNERFQIDVQALRQAISDDRASGCQPFCVVASAGTVNTGAIDRLDELADLCARENLWLHVDGAYGAIGVLDPERASRFDGMERVDSLALDPHKWLAVPVECGCALVRDEKVLRDTFSLVPPYLRTEEGKGFGGLPWFSEYGSQQTRGFRALKLWMVLQQAGRAGLTALVCRHNALAERLAVLIDADHDLERLAPVELSIVCFRFVPAELRGDDSRLSAVNKAIMEKVQSGGEAFLSGTVLRGRFALRACILHYATTEADIRALLDVVRRVGADEVARLPRDE
jgi:aromatic-L-amino-acid/L-tryptophan decarboxylase